MQIDKLVQLIESPVFVHLRLQLLDVESPHHAPLLKSCYGLLMLLPQSDAFRSLNDRLTAVCNLRDNLGIPPTTSSPNKSRLGPLSERQRDLLAHFDAIMDLHRSMRGRESQQLMMLGQTQDGMSRNRPANAGSVSAKGGHVRALSGAAGAVVSSNGNAFHGEHGGASPVPNRGRITQET